LDKKNHAKPPGKEKAAKDFLFLKSLVLLCDLGGSAVYLFFCGLEEFLTPDFLFHRALPLYGGLSCGSGRFRLNYQNFW